MTEIRDDEWKHFEHFKKEEFACKHCGKCHMDLLFIAKLHKSRVISDVPYIITSGYRCPEHDKSLKGSGNHPTGQAADIGVASSRWRHKVLSGLFAAGFKRIGIAKSFIHVDDVAGKPQEVVWLY